MDIYCIGEFKRAFDNLLKKSAYKSLETEVIDYFFSKEVKDVLSGKRLNNSTDAPYIKKRLDGSGGYRVYFLVKIVSENLYFMFVHPKTGPGGSDNIKDESKAKIYKDVLEAINNNNLYKLSLNAEKNKIVFTEL